MNEKIPTRTVILEASIPLLASRGYAGTSIRDVAEAAQVKPSVIYHYFTDKAELLRAVRITITTRLATDMQALSPVSSARERLRQILWFQIDHIEEAVALLQYFMAVKHDFPLQPSGYVPERAYQHVREVIERGCVENVYTSRDAAFDAKVLTHMVNGFLLEYYPHEMTEEDTRRLVEQLADFIERSLGYREVV